MGAAWINRTGVERANPAMGTGRGRGMKMNRQQRRNAKANAPAIAEDIC